MEFKFEHVSMHLFADEQQTEELLREHLEGELLSWSSVLDYHSEQTESGMALELVVFPGESLPKVPSAAKLKVRPWNPEEDIPFCMRAYATKIAENLE